MLYNIENKPCLVYSCGYIYIYIYIYIKSPVALNFCILVLLFVNGLQALYINPCCLKYISGMNLSPANKNFLIMLFVVINLEQNVTQNWYLAQRSSDS